ncbi:hypothetical protein DRA42_03775 [Ethanoligenens harbinense]|nr:hypothetical protein CXQ68_03780 [Ethanoligenens harbinense YUAN-3]AYF38099.1 hypothetical protein CXP51_03635 [Ethanoligenens harbinense]AYF40844.1 hypothetical protein CN246_03770 [Ethanoligenens harbinense]QCN91674.1 hypothetical protein DRA42_03775 [Ethanoligenens harbinense]
MYTNSIFINKHTICLMWDLTKQYGGIGMKKARKLLSAGLAVAIAASVFGGVSFQVHAAGATAGTPYSSTGTYDVAVPHVIINQVYGGYNSSKDKITNNPDGTFSITYKDKGQACSNSFIELYNPTSADVNLNGWSVQYATSPYYPTNQPTAVQNGQWAVLPLTGTIKAHSSYLIRGAATGSTAVAPGFGLDLTGMAADQDWNMPINTKGLAVALMSNTTQLTANSDPFDNTAHAPAAAGYVDMIGVNGNDGTTTSPTNEIISAYEGDVTNSQSKQKAIRRMDFADTDNNATVDDASGNQAYDTQIIGYNTSDQNFLNWARPRCGADGAWSASEEPNPVETTTLSSTAINCLTNSFGSDPRTTHTFTWEMPASVTSGLVRISKSGDMSNAKTYAAAATSSDSGTANTFRVTATGLTAGTTYYYTAENGGVTSNVYSFTTEDQTVNSFSFLHISDTQADVQTDTTGAKLSYSTWGNAISTVLKQYKPDFLFETGDIVDQANSEDQWRWFFGAAQDALGDCPYLPVIGNHDQSTAYPATAFREHFTVPNACTDANVTPGTTYSFDYGAAHFVVLDSEDKGDGFAAQHAWADADMAKTKQPFIIVALHRGMYGGSGISDTFTAFGDLLDKYSVSLVLQGHDHAYIRTKSMKSNNGNPIPATDGTGTISLETGGSGSKQDNAPTLQDYMDTVATPNAPCYSLITVTNSQIQVHTVTVQNATNPTADSPATVEPLQTSAKDINPTDAQIDFTINAPAARQNLGADNTTSSGNGDDSGSSTSSGNANTSATSGSSGSSTVSGSSAVSASSASNPYTGTSGDPTAAAVFALSGLGALVVLMVAKKRSGAVGKK